MSSKRANLGPDSIAVDCSPALQQCRPCIERPGEVTGRNSLHEGLSWATASRVLCCCRCNAAWESALLRGLTAGKVAEGPINEGWYRVSLLLVLDGLPVVLPVREVRQSRPRVNRRRTWTGRQDVDQRRTLSSFLCFGAFFAQCKG